MAIDGVLILVWACRTEPRKPQRVPYAHGLSLHQTLKVRKVDQSIYTTLWPRVQFARHLEIPGSAYAIAYTASVSPYRSMVACPRHSATSCIDRGSGDLMWLSFTST